MDNAKVARLNEIVTAADVTLNRLAEAGRQLGPGDAQLLVIARLVHDLAGTVQKLAVEVRDTEANPKPAVFGKAVR